MKKLHFDRTIGEYVTVFLIGAFFYPLLETAFRGYSHVSMVIAGGICFSLVYKCSCQSELPVFLRPLLSALSITAVELITGLIVNRWLDLGVWDYSAQPFQFMGQICLIFSFLWLLLSAVALPFCVMLKRLFTDQR